MNNVDFLPERIKTNRARRRRVVRQGYLLTACVVGLGLLGYARCFRIDEAQAELLQLDQQVANVQTQLEIREELEKTQAGLLIIQRIEEQLGSRADTLDVLSELESVLPDSIALRSLKLETMEVNAKANPAALPSGAGRVWRPGNNPAGGRPISRDRWSGRQGIARLRLTLKGVAPTDVDVANFIGQLSANRLFEDVNMGYAKNVLFHDRAARQFEANCYVVR